MKKILYICIGIALAVTGTVFAVNVTVPSATNVGQILTSTSTGAWIATTTNPLFIGSIYASSTTATSTFQYSVKSPCFTNDGTTCLVSGTGSSFPFTTTTHWGQTTQGTTTALWLQGSPFSLFASSTVAFDNASTTLLTVSGTIYNNLMRGVASTGNPLAINAGQPTGTSDTGNSITLTASDGGSVSGNGGSITLTGGNSPGATPGTVSLVTNSNIAAMGVDGIGPFLRGSTVNKAYFNTGSLSGNKTFTFPDKSLTVAGINNETFTGLTSMSYSSSTLYSSFVNASSTFGTFGTLNIATTTAGCASITSAGKIFSTGTACGSGAGGTPGGSDTQIQYNDGGSFNGNSNLTYNKSSGVLNFGGGSPSGLFTINSSAYLREDSNYLAFGATETNSIDTSSNFNLVGATGIYGLSNTGSFKALLDTNSLSANRTFTFPNQSGTLCLTTTCTGITSYDAFTHPFAGSSATTSTMITTANSSSTIASVYGFLETPYLTATSTTATSTFRGNLLVSPSNNTLGFPYAGMDLKIVDSTAVGPTQAVVQNTSVSGAGLSSFTLGNNNTVWTSNPYTSTYYTGLYMASPYFNTYPGLLPNDSVLVSSDANLRFAALSTNTASSSMSWSVGPGFSSANYDMFLKATVNGQGYLGIGTTTPQWPSDIISTTTPQLALGDGTNPQWTFRNAGGNLYLGTTSPTTFATSTLSFLSFDGTNGRLGINKNNPSVTLDIKGSAILADSLNNTFISAGNTTLTGTFNAGIAGSALVSLTTGANNLGIGSSALSSDDSGSDNVGVGSSALGNISGNNGQNVAIGSNALANLLGASSTVAIGYLAGQGPSLGFNKNNTFIGWESGLVTAGNSNTFVGYGSGNKVTSGSKNIVIGGNDTLSNDNLTTGSHNIKIGYDISFPSASNSNQLNIGNIIYGTTIDGAGATVSTGNLGIGTSTPYTTLDIATASSSAGAIQKNPFGQLVEMTIGGVWYMVESFDYYGHKFLSGPSPTCDANCTFVKGNDNAFRVTLGSAVTSSTVTFARTWGTLAPICISNEGSAGTVDVSASSTPTTVVLTALSSLTSKDVEVICQGIR